MDDTKKGPVVMDEQGEPMGETGGDVRSVVADTKNEETGQKGGEAAQQKQEQSYEVFGQKDETPEPEASEEKSAYDLWGEE